MTPKRIVYDLIARRMGYVRPIEKFTPDERLEKLLAHAAAHVPYYREVLAAAGVKTAAGIDLSKFTSVPALTKEILRTRTEDLISTTTDRSKATWNTSGGSTGEPVRLLQDHDYLVSARHATHEQEQMTGYKLGDSIVKLWGDERELLQGAQTKKARLFNVIKNQTFMNAFLMTPERMREYINRLNRIKPKLLIAYAQALYELSMFAEAEGLKITGPQAIMTSAGTLYPFMREVIERVTGKKVFNRYGSREVGNIAIECEEHNGMHVASKHVKVEIVDENLQPCPPGVEGEILVTTLANYSMPLIRYRIGDYGAFQEGACACGRPGPMLADVVGRVTDAFRTESGKVIPAEYFIHIIGVVLNRGAIRKFQVVQKSLTHVVVNAVPTDSYTDADGAEIEDKIQAVMGADVRVDIEKMANIPALSSGKYRYTIREIP
jgi:phenylacetate-CoA ligase